MGSPPENRQGKESVRVTIFNQSYTIATKGDPREAEYLADEVNQLMLEVASRTGYGDSLRIAVLACLHLADQLSNTRGRLAAFEEEAADLTHRLASLFDQLSPAGTHEQD